VIVCWPREIRSCTCKSHATRRNETKTSMGGIDCEISTGAARAIKCRGEAAERQPPVLDAHARDWCGSYDRRDLVPRCTSPLRTWIPTTAILVDIAARCATLSLSATSAGSSALDRSGTMLGLCKGILSRQLLVVAEIELAAGRLLFLACCMVGNAHLPPWYSLFQA
jgi:hypothetical protein